MILKNDEGLRFRPSETSGAAIALYLAGSFFVIGGVFCFVTALSDTGPAAPLEIGEGLGGIFAAICMFGFGAALSRLKSIDENLAGFLQYRVVPTPASPNLPAEAKPPTPAVQSTESKTLDV